MKKIYYVSTRDVADGIVNEATVIKETEKTYIAKIGGLAQSWRGETVFCNPPYGRDLAKWVAKAHAEVSAGGYSLIAS